MRSEGEVSYIRGWIRKSLIPGNRQPTIDERCSGYRHHRYVLVSPRIAHGGEGSSSGPPRPIRKEAAMASVRHAAAIVGMLAVMSIQFASAATVPQIVSVSDLASEVTAVSGDKPNNGFASQVMALGDINGDGYEDVAFWGAYGAEGEEDIVFVLYGSRDLPRTLNVAEATTWGIRLHATGQGRFPMPLGRPGDVDGDGYSDTIFAGCQDADGVVTCPGYLLFGGPDLPRDIDTSALTGCRGCVILPDEEDEKHAFPWRCTSGDVNGDGLPDIILAAASSYFPGYPQWAGIVYVVFGTTAFPSEIDLTEIGRGVPGVKITTGGTGVVNLGANLGATVDAGIDFNGDGIRDIVLSAPRWGEDSAASGAVFVVFGRTAWVSPFEIGTSWHEENAICYIRSTQSGTAIGASVLEGTPDMTGDGIPDLVLSGGWQTSNTYIVSGAALAPGMFDIEPLTTYQLLGVTDAPFLARGIGDRNGDGIYDFAASYWKNEASIPGIAADAGAVYLVDGRHTWPSPTLLSQFDRIMGAREGESFGYSFAAADMNGDGVRDLVVGAPGQPLGWLSPELPGDLPGALYVIPSGISLNQELECGAFAPQTSTLAGGARLFVTGRGFDGETEVSVGNVKAEVLERPHSRMLIARLPAQEEPGDYELRLHRGEAACIAAGVCAYYSSLFPGELDIAELGSGGCTITCCVDPESVPCLEVYSQDFEGGEDVTGDGLADVLVLPYGRKGGSVKPLEWGCSVHVIHGATNLPPEILLWNDSSAWATTLVLEGDGACREEALWDFGDTAVAVGDMTGDSISELAVASPHDRQVFIIAGGELPKGRVSVDDLPEGNVHRIEGCPGGTLGDHDIHTRVIKIGDVNGDGLADLGLFSEFAADENGRIHGAIAFVLGSKALAASMDYSSLPILWGMTHSVFANILVSKAVGDVDGDGCDDIFVYVYTGLPLELGDDPRYTGSCIFYGRRDFPKEMTFENELATGGMCIILAPSSDYGFVPGGIGDQNGDGVDDIAVASDDADGQVEKSRLTVIYGGSRDRLCTPRQLGNDLDFDVVFPLVPVYNAKILVVSGGRDVSGDGVPDILLSDRHRRLDTLPSRAIALWGGNLEAKAAPIPNVRDRMELVEYEETWGSFRFFNYPVRYDFAGDVNGDGYEDVVVYDGGHAYVYYNPLGSLRGAFVRGDANQDARIDIADAITVLGYLFSGAGALPCMDAGDVNDDEKVDVADAIRLLMWLFRGGAVPPPNECGPDPQGDTLGCAESICR